ncbi:MAG: DUF4968 domain-containing protein [Anaerolineae bacterium]|nr:DUF4968 domain-containing protein [Anaerolineae bacterium]
MGNLLSRAIEGLRTLGLRTTLRAVLYPARKRYHEGRFAATRGLPEPRSAPIQGALSLLAPRAEDADARAGAAPSYAFPGRVLAWQRQALENGAPQRVMLTCENAMVEIAVLAPDLVRVRVSPSGQLPAPFSYAVAHPEGAWPPLDLAVDADAQYLTLRTARLQVKVALAHLSIAFLDPGGAAVCSDAAGAGWERNGERVFCWKEMPAHEHIYGLGQKTVPLDKRGRTFEMWNYDPQVYDPGDDPIYTNIPFYVGLVDGRAYGLFYDNTARARFDFGLHTPGIARFEAECGELRYYYFYGPALGDVLDRYTQLTGRMAMPPLWALGYHQMRWSYTPDARVREVAQGFRARAIPCDAIHLDIDYMDGYRCFTWDPEGFPDPGQLVADLHADGFRVVAMIDPGIKADRTYAVCREGLKRGAFCTYPDGSLYSGPVWAGESYFADYTSPAVRAWWGACYQDMVELGVDGFLNDMNEPTVFGHAGDTFPSAVRHDWEGQGADHRLAHNVYGMLMARATAEGLRALRPQERPFLIARSLWAGAQRYSAHWLGDNRSDWASLGNVLPLALNMGLSGIAFTGPDTGGFSGSPDGELLIRWNQMSAFLPLFRNHTAKHTSDQEPWAFGESCERISRQAIALRYHMLPYLYTACWQAAQRGLPIARPLALAFQDDPHAAAIDDTFMCGDALLVAPVTERGATSRRLYIPRGRWIDWWTGRHTAGPQITRLDAPIHRIPLLVRAGSAIPAWPAMQHTGERPVDVLILHLFPGTATSWLYEDDGHSTAFQTGACRVTRLDCTLERGNAGAAAQLRVARSTEGRYQPAYDRVRVHVHGLGAAPEALHVDDAPLSPAEAQYDADTRTYTFETRPFDSVALTLAHKG